VAPNAKIFVVELGMQTVSLAEFRLLPAEGLALCSFTQAKLKSDPSLKEFCYDQLKAILYQWRKEKKIKRGKKLIIGLPSQSLLIRFLKLPGATFRNVQAVMGFEAQQNILCPLHEIIWDYQIIAPPSEGTWEVILVATKAALFSRLKQTIMEAGFLIETVDAALLALYNAFRFNYADTKGCSLIIEFRSDSTNLIFSENGKFFIRAIRCSFPSTAHLSTPFPIAHKIYVSSNFDLPLKQIQKEIISSVSFYCNQQGGSPPIRIFICGTGELNILQEGLREELQMEINIFDPMRNVQATAGSRTALLSSLGSIVGLATRGLKNVPIEVDLLSSETIREATRLRRRPFLMAAGFCLILTLASSWFYFSRAIALKTRVLKRAEAQLLALKTRDDQFQKLRSENEQLTLRLEPLLNVIRKRAVWPTLINTLETSLPAKYIWITRLEPVVKNQPIFLSPFEWNKEKKPHDPLPTSDQQHLLIEGLYLENPQQAKVVDQFVENLAQSAFFLISDKAKVVHLRDTPDGEHWAYRYRLVLPLN